MSAQFHANTGESTGKRSPLDVYETPSYVTEALLRHVELQGPILEPAAGSGRISRVLRKAGFDVTEMDVRTGQDYRDYKEEWHGDIVTNPPYKSGLAELFVRKALKTCTGRVAMLMRSGFLWSGDRRELFLEHPPELIVIIPERVFFYEEDGTRIPGQAHSHEWIVWPPAALSEGIEVQTRVEWSSDAGRTK